MQGVWVEVVAEDNAPPCGLHCTFSSACSEVVALTDRRRENVEGANRRVVAVSSQLHHALVEGELAERRQTLLFKGFPDWKRRMRG